MTAATSEASAAEQAMETLDVSALKSFAFGTRSTLFWGVILLCLIEFTVLAILFTSYFYLRGNFDSWPPSGPIPLGPGIASTVVLSLSLVPIVMCGRSARELDLKRTRKWQTIGTLVGFVGLGLRYLEMKSLPFMWSENAYTTVVWVSLGAHAVDYVAEMGEMVVLTALLYKGPVEEKHFEDVEVNAFFWAFLVLAWLPFAAVFYSDGAMR